VSAVFDKEFEEILIQEAIIMKKTGTEYGKPVYEDEENGAKVDIYWESKNQLIKTDDGREVTSSAFGMVRSDENIEVGDLIKSPFGKEWEILDVQSTPDILNKKEVHHKEVYV